MAERKKLTPQDFQAILDSIGAAVFVFQGEGNVYANPASEELTGYSIPELLSMAWWEFIHPEFREIVRSRGRQRLRKDSDPEQDRAAPPRYELKILTKAGEEKWIDYTARPVSWNGGTAVLGVAKDITDRVETTFELDRARRKTRALLEAIPDLMFLIDPDGRIVEYFAHDSDDLMLPRDQVLGAVIFDYLPQAVIRSYDESVRELRRSNEVQIFDYHLDLPAGRREYEARLVLVDELVLVVSRDITDRKRIEETIRHMAFHDSLTGLPNRSGLTDFLERLLAGGAERLALMYMDLDRFKLINDSLGHAAGDEVLKNLSREMRARLSDEVYLARQGGDEFILVQQPLENLEAAYRTVDTLLEIFERPIEIQGREFFVAASVGIVLAPDHGGDTATLLKNADRAMYWIKKRGGNGVHLYRDEIAEYSREHLERETSLHRALDAGRLEPYFQPRVGPDGRVVGFEALARWMVDGRILPADEFISLAEESGLVADLDQLMFRRTAELRRDWVELLPEAVRVAVNFSPRSFLRERLGLTVLETLEELGLPPACMEIEITENTLLQNPEQAGEVLRRFAERGIAVSLDDFGKGYSSLGQLKGLPIHTLKIDRSFVAGLPGDAEGAAIVDAMLALGRAMSKNVVAEGVETERQFLYLKERGCVEFQGYYFARPLPAAEVPAFIRQNARQKTD